MSAAFLNRFDLNVITVDWMLGAAPPYTQAVANTRLVGSIIANLIKVIQVSQRDSLVHSLTRQPIGPHRTRMQVATTRLGYTSLAIVLAHTSLAMPANWWPIWARSQASPVPGRGDHS